MAEKWKSESAYGECNLTIRLEAIQKGSGQVKSVTPVAPSAESGSAWRFIIIWTSNDD